MTNTVDTPSAASPAFFPSRLRAAFFSALPACLVALAVIASGCTPKPGDPEVIAAAQAAAGERGAVLFSPEGSVYHIELSLDRDEGLLTLRTLGPDGASPLETSGEGFELRVTADGRERFLILAPVANPATGEFAGGTSRYEGYGDWLKVPGEVGVVIESITLRGKKFDKVSAVIPAVRPAGG